MDDESTAHRTFTWVRWHSRCVSQNDVLPSSPLQLLGMGKSASWQMQYASVLRLTIQQPAAWRLRVRRVLSGEVGAGHDVIRGHYCGTRPLDALRIDARLYFARPNGIGG